MTLHSVRRGRPGPSLAGVAKREDSYGPKSGPKAGSRASSPGEQAAACDYMKKLVCWADKLPHVRGTASLMRPWAKKAWTVSIALPGLGWPSWGGWKRRV